MLFSLIFVIDEDVIKIYYHKDVKLFCQNLANVALECGRCIDQLKRHHRVLKMAIAGFKDCLPFISFPDFYLMIGINQIKLGKTSNPAQSI